jgi:hypothetical protein
MVVAAMAAVILGGVAFTRIVNTLAALADAPRLQNDFFRSSSSPSSLYGALRLF